MSISIPSNPSPDAALADIEIRVSAPSRLHFGLMSLDRRNGRRFGGVGLMIDAPGVCVRIRPSKRLEVSGPLADRAEEFAARYSAHIGHDPPVPVAITVEHAPPDHVGLGTGTQLALAVAAAINTYCGQPLEDVNALAQAVGRGKRSAIGVHGFSRGGLLVEFGSLPSERIAPLQYRANVPDAWRFILIRPESARGTSGTTEDRAFAELPAVSAGFTRALQDEVSSRMVPSLQQSDFNGFAESMYRYGSLAGEAFAPFQGGRFATERMSQLVTQIREWGWPGVIQTSWGPTLAVAAPSDEDAARLVSRLSSDDAATDLATRDLQTIVARPQNCGASISRRRGDAPA